MKNFLIYGGVCFGIILVMNLFKLGDFKKNYDKIGVPLLKIDKESQSLSFFAQVFRVVIGFVVLVLYFYLKKEEEFNWINLGFVSCMSFMLGSFVYPLFMKNVGLGLYEKGAVTQYGVRLYDDCKYYNFNIGRNGATVLNLASKVPIVQGVFIIIPADLKAKAKSILMKKMPYYDDVTSERKGLFGRKKD